MGGVSALGLATVVGIGSETSCAATVTSAIGLYEITGDGECGGGEIGGGGDVNRGVELLALSGSGS